MDGKSETQLAPIRRKIGMIFQQFNLFNSAPWPGTSNRSSAPAGSRRNASNGLPASGFCGADGQTETIGAVVRRSKTARGYCSRAGFFKELLLADESTSATDPETTQEVLGLLKRVNRELGITNADPHEMDVVRSIADQVAVMDTGRVVAMGTTSDVFAYPQAETTRKFVSSVMRTVPARTRMAKLREEHRVA